MIPAGARFVQVGMFGDPDNARRAAKRLSSMGLPVSQGQTAVRGRQLQTIMAGPFDSRQVFAAYVGYMRAIHISSLDGPEAVELVDVPAPADPRQVTIEVKAAAEGARVVAYSSAGHHLSDIRWDDMHFTTGYDKWLAYGQAKTATSLFAVHLDAIADDVREARPSGIGGRNGSVGRHGDATHAQLLRHRDRHHQHAENDAGR